MKSIYEYLVKNHTSSINDIEMREIDFGLPSGIVWGDRNLGADSPSDGGDFFMFGTLEPSDDCWWSNSPLNGGKDTYSIEDFENDENDIYNHTTLKLNHEADAAEKILGEPWRIPSKAQFLELLQHTFIELGSLDGVKGIFFKSKNPQYTDSMFIPFSGRKYRHNLEEAGNRFFLMSSKITRFMGKDYKSCIILRGTQAGLAVIDTGFLCQGLSIRPIKKKK